MENNSNNFETTMWDNWQESHKRGKIFGGLLLVTIGGLFLAREMGVELPHWIFSWKVLMIVMGLYIGVKYKFRRLSWLVLVVIGGLFLVQDFYPEFTISHYFWPVAIIVFGLLMIFKPRGRYNEHRWKRWQRHKSRHWQYDSTCATDEKKSTVDAIEISAVMAGIKKNIISKDFKGGEINAVLGGAEINLSQSDIVGKATLEINVVLGGVKLIVPSHWDIQSELTATLGGVEDKRQLQSGLQADATKTLILKGVVFLGGIDIRSF